MAVNQSELKKNIESALNTKVRDIQIKGASKSGQIAVATFEDERRAFIKFSEVDASEMFEVEAAGLRWLGKANAIRVPDVWACEGSLLVMDLIEQAKPTRNYWSEFGTQLARLHQFGTSDFGWDRDGYIGPLPQNNIPADKWPEFYQLRRLEPLAQQAIDRGLLPRDAIAEFDQLFAKFPELCGPVELPARIHGDLWFGNHMAGPNGEPVIFDPAPYGAHREMEFGMMTFLGGFPKELFDAYNDTYPLAPDWRDRSALYEMYHALTHTLIFGHGFSNAVIERLNQYV